MIAAELPRIRIVGLERVLASSLVPHPQNWRRHPERQRSALRAAMAEVGVITAPIVRPIGDNRYEILDGHLRGELLGDQVIPVIVTDLTDAEAQAALLTTDTLTGLAEIDADALAGLLQGVGSVEAELQDLLADLAAALDRPVVTGLTDADAIPEQVEPRSERGTLWQLGRHRLLCGDSTNAADVDRLLDGAKPALMITDSPYGVAYDPTWRPGAKRTGTVPNDDRADWTAAWRLFPGDVAYCWHASLHADVVYASMTAVGFEHRAVIIWVKPTHTFGRGHYHWRHEPCLYAVRRGHAAGWIGGRKQTTVWEIDHVHATAGITDDGATVHGTQKPVACMERPLRNHRGDVYDPFVGSGTTVIAAERVGRACFALEIEPRYVDVAVRRWEEFTGEQAVQL